jgi:hypothetical protein
MPFIAYHDFSIDESFRRYETMRKAHAIAMLALLLGSPVRTPAESPDKAELTVVKYPELGKILRQYRGKVVVMDLWAMW